MLRDPDLIPEPWRTRRIFRPHPLLALPLFPLVGFVVLLVGAIDDPSVEAWVWVAHLLALTLVASVASPWHLPRRPVYDPVGRTITFPARATLGLMPVGLVIWGVVLLVHFELMRLLVIDRQIRFGDIDVPWWLTLPMGFVMIALGLSVARPPELHQLMVGVDGLHFVHGRQGFSAQWDHMLRILPTLEHRVHRCIQVYGPGLAARDARGHRTHPTFHADVLDSDAVRLWLTLDYYFQHPSDREELGTAACRERRAQWRRVLPREMV